MITKTQAMKDINLYLQHEANTDFNFMPLLEDVFSIKHKTLVTDESLIRGELERYDYAKKILSETYRSPNFASGQDVENLKSEFQLKHVSYDVWPIIEHALNTVYHL